MDFHYKLIEACGNPLQLDICARLSDAADVYRAWSGPGSREVHRDIAGEHKNLLLASPGSANLFHKAILQSCSVAATTQTVTIESQEHMGTALAAAAGCVEHTPQNLRALSTKDLMAANATPKGTFGVGTYHIGLVADGTVVPEPMKALFETGRFNRVPVINGTNRDEFAWFQAMVELATGHVLTEAEYPHVVEPVLSVASDAALLGAVVPPEAIPDVLVRYPLSAHPGPSRALAAIVGDCGLICNGNRRTTRILKRYVSEVYSYEFDVPDSPASSPSVSFPYGSSHVQELQYLFPLFKGGGGVSRELSPAQQRLAEQMVHYWTNFAKRGTPNAETPQAPIWPVYDPEEDNVMALRVPEPTVLSAFGDTRNCDFWDPFAQ